MVGIQGLVRNGLHLAGLSSFAFAQQYFEPLADGPDFLIERGMTPLDVGLVRVRVVVVPRLRAARAGSARRPRPRACAGRLHLVFIAGLVALIAWQAITGAEPGVRPLVAYAVRCRWAPRGPGRTRARSRSGVPPSRVAPVVVLGLFLGSPRSAPSRSAAEARRRRGSRPTARRGPGGARRAATATLIDARGGSTRGAFPGFAALARDSRGTATRHPPPTTPSSLCRPSSPAADRARTCCRWPRSTLTTSSRCSGEPPPRRLRGLTDICRTPCTRQVREPFARRMRGLTASTIDKVPALPAGCANGCRTPSRPRAPLRRRAAARLGVTSAASCPPPRTCASSDSSTRWATVAAHGQLPAPHPPPPALASTCPTGGARRPRTATVGASRASAVVTTAWRRHVLQTQLRRSPAQAADARLRATGAYDRSLVVVVADHGAAFLPARSRGS